MTERIALLVGTRKGLFVLDGDTDRDSWNVRGPLCDGWPIHDAIYDKASGAIYAGGGSNWYGPAVWRSNDLGETWSHSSEGITYGDDAEKVATIWSLATGPRDAMYAGVEPAGLFRSSDGGSTWSHVEGLTNHPSRPEWQPGNGGLILHSIVPSFDDADRVWVGISSVGAFETDDGGKSWSTRNKGVRAGFMPEGQQYPDFGQCVHKLVMAADGGEHLYQQNHCGVYRSTDGGRQWEEVTANGLPTEFGFPMAAHPRDPNTAWTIPMTEPDQGRFMVDGHAAVYRTNDGGDSWTKATDGLPHDNAYISVLREAMAVDRLDPVGVYFGTPSGEVWATTDEAASFRCLFRHLPHIFSVTAGEPA
jgi:photosystem II stability/assembly factor-like uncharacterized protein